MVDAEPRPDQGARRRVLVIADKTCPCPELHERIRARAHRGVLEVLVVGPALSSRLRHWVFDTDDAVAAAEARLARAVRSLREAEIDAGGEVGDADPLSAIGDSLAVFEADEVMISTHPPGRSHGLERNLIERARDRHPVTVTHVISEYRLEVAA